MMLLISRIILTIAILYALFFVWTKNVNLIPWAKKQIARIVPSNEIEDANNNRIGRFTIFAKYQEEYKTITEKRKNTWKKIKEKVLSNPKTKHEIPDKSSSFDYINLRINQKEKLYAIEHQLIEEEIKSLNILNEICQYALGDPQKINMVQTLYSSDISFYQNHIDKLLEFRELCTKERLFSVPKYDAIKKMKIEDSFGK